MRHVDSGVLKRDLRLLEALLSGCDRVLMRQVAVTRNTKLASVDAKARSRIGPGRMRSSESR